MQADTMKTIFDRYRLTLLTAAALASVALLAGCSHTPDAASSAGTAGGPSAAQAGAPPTVEGIQSNASQIQSDTSLTPAQKQIMMNENQHAMQKATAGSH